MPELPDVATFRKYFEKHAIGRKVASVQLKDPRITRGLPDGELEKALHGKKFNSTRQHGKYLFAETKGGKWLVMHFGMTGYLQYFEKPEEDPKYDRMLIRFEKNGFLAYVNQRMLGWIGLAETPDKVIEQRGLGRSALDPKLDYSEFENMFSGLKGEIKPALMNQGLLAGIGNVYSDEILFQAGVHPKRKVGTLIRKELESIFENIGKVLRTAIEKNADVGDLPENYLLRNRRKGGNCPVCGTRLESAKVGGRTSYFCPKCQKT